MGCAPSALTHPTAAGFMVSCRLCWGISIFIGIRDLKMKTTLTIKNYRCFASPTVFDIQNGFTAFVGMNNAGKSTAMRFLLEFRPLFSVLSSPGGLTNCIKKPQGLGQFLHVLDQEEVFSNLNMKGIEIEFHLHSEKNENKNYRHIGIVVSLSRERRYQAVVSIDGLLLEVDKFQGFNTRQEISVAGGPDSDFSDFFRLMASLANTLYVGPFRNTINIGSKEDYLDIKIGEAFIAEFRALKTGPKKQDNAGISRLTEQIRNIFRFSALDISPASDNRSLHLTVNGRPFKQHELGSGLSHFIIVLANAAVKKPDWILIDEPEMNLHPSLQLEFLTALGDYAKEGVWFSTHSLGLARSAAERIYSVASLDEGNSVVRSLSVTPRLSEFLGEMSFSSQKELGFEKVLLVEGPTELKVIKHFLRGLSKEHRILLLPIHGHMPQPDEFDDLRRITTNVAALIDSEKAAKDSPLDKNRAEFVELCKRTGVACLALELGATENYFPDEVIKAVFGQEYRGLRPYEKLKQLQPRWSKNQNWRIAEAMSFNQIEKTDLGVFLQNL
jgi:predicted ATPase